MTIDEAIKRLSGLLEVEVLDTSVEEPDAIKLGIEALKRIQYARQHCFTETISPLPGEPKG